MSEPTASTSMLYALFQTGLEALTREDGTLAALFSKARGRQLEVHEQSLSMSTGVSRPAPRSLSVFFPAYNDARSIGHLVAAADRTAKELTEDYEIIVVDDGSSDDTPAILRSLRQEFPRLRVVSHAVNRGYGGALQSGFRAALNEAIFYTDGDGQYDPSQLGELWRALAGGADIAQGYKVQRRDPAERVVIGAIYNAAVKRLFGLRVRDVDCDFRLIRREVFAKVALSRDSGAICVELVKKTQDAGFVFVEVPVQHYPRRHGRSWAFRPAQILHMLLDLVVLWRDVR